MEGNDNLTGAPGYGGHAHHQAVEEAGITQRGVVELFE